MTIGIEAQRLLRAQRHGMDVVALELLRRLPAAAPHHRFVAFVRPGENRSLPEAPNLIVREVEAPSYPLWEQVALPRAAKAAGVDVLHCTANTAPLRPGVPLVLTLHDLIFLEQGPLGEGGTAYQRAGNLYRRFVAPRAARIADRVATVSHTEAGVIAARLPDVADRLVVTPNAVDAAFARRADASAHTRVAAFAPATGFFLALGSEEPRKNLPVLLAAFARYVAATPAPHPLVLTGLNRSVVLRHLRALGLADLAVCIVTPGFVSTPELAALYARCTAFVYPSRREGFGLPVLEAMACGAPVVTSAASAMPEVAGGAALLADPDDPNAFAAHLMALHHTPRLRAQLAVRGLARAASSTWDAAVATLVATYEAVAEEARAARTQVRSSARARWTMPRPAFVEAAGASVETA